MIMSYFSKIEMPYRKEVIILEFSGEYYGIKTQSKYRQLRQRA